MFLCLNFHRLRQIDKYFPTFCPSLVSHFPQSRKVRTVRTLTVQIMDTFCVTQLKLHTVDKLSSSIFCCLSVCQASVSPDQISTFSNIYRHTSPMLTLYHVIPSSASFYWPSTTKYQTVSPYTDPVPAGTTYNSSFRKAQLNNFSFYDSFDEPRTVYLV